VCAWPQNDLSYPTVVAEFLEEVFGARFTAVLGEDEDVVASYPMVC
jgi:hypothetical protein